MKQLKKIMFSVLIVIMLLCTFIIKTEVKAQTSTEPQLTVYKNNVSYKDSVYFMYAVSYENIDITQYDIQLLFWNTKQDSYEKGTEKYYKEVSRTQTVSGVDCVIYYSDGIAAKNIVDDIYTRAYVKIGDKEYYSEVNKTSVVDYLLRMIEGGTLNTNQKNLFNALLAYGAAAQNNFDYKTDQLATATYYNINVINGVTSDGFTYGRYKENTTITITANEKEGYVFINWTDSIGNIVSEENIFELTVTNSEIYTANYVKDESFIIPEYKVTSEEGYDVTASTLELPEFIEVEYKGNIYNIPVSFDTSTFVENQIGKQVLYGTITDNTILSETNIIIESVCLEVNVLPYTFEIDTTTQGYAIVKYYGNEEKVEIPNVFNNKEVTTIRKNAFYNLSCIKELVISDNVTKIEQQAIYSCDNIEKLTLPVLDTFIGYYFGASSYSYNSTYIPMTLKEVVLSNKVTYIGSSAFYKCTSLTSITIPNSVTSIGYSAFYNCTSLTSIEIPNSVTSIGHHTFYNCTLLESIEIPNSVTSIGDNAFENCTSLTSIEIPNSVTRIGSNAFYNCSSLESIEIPNSVTSIEHYAFVNCTSLTSVTIPNSVTSIGDSAFKNCTSLENVYYNGTIEDWCKIVFNYYSSNPMDYASHIYMLDSNNEYYEVTTIEIPNTITKIGNYQFCGFENVTSVTIPNSVTSIGNYAFDGCSSLTNITIPNSVTSIGNHAFHYCTSLEEITIPNSVTSIGDSAFLYCTSLSIICEAESQPSGWSSSWNCSKRPVYWDGGIYTVILDVDCEGIDNIEYECSFGTIELPTPTKEGYVFYGWYEESLTTPIYYKDTYDVSKDVVLKAMWAYTVELDLNGGSIYSYTKTKDVKIAFANDYRQWALINNASYASSWDLSAGRDVTQCGNIWDNEMYKFFLDPVYGVKWVDLLQYFYDVEAAYEANVVPTYTDSKYPGTSSIFFDLKYWESLIAGDDLVELYGAAYAPYIIPFTMESWLESKHYIGTYYHTADYSSEEVQDKVLDYLKKPAETIIYVPVGEKVKLPNCVTVMDGVDVKLYGWQLKDGTYIDGDEFIPKNNMILKAIYGSKVTLNANVDEVDPLLEELTKVDYDILNASETYSLPQLSRNNYNFLGWYDSLNYQYNEISFSTGKVDLIAKWEPIAYEIKFIIQREEIDAKNVSYNEVIGELPFIIKDNLMFAGWYLVDGTETGEWGDKITEDYIISSNLKLYAKYINDSEEKIIVTPETIEKELGNATIGSVLELTSGTYEGVYTINTDYVTIKGTHDSIINSPIIINANCVTIDGIKLGEKANIQIGGDYATIKNIYSISTNAITPTGTSRKGVIITVKEVKDITISDSYFNIGSSVSIKGVFVAVDTLTNATFKNNYFTNDATYEQLSACLTAHEIAGKIEIIGNVFEYVTDYWNISLGDYLNNCELINIIDNTFKGKVVNGAELYTCGIRMPHAPAKCVVNIIHNEFGWLEGTIISGTNSGVGSVYNIKYNKFLNTSYKQGASSGYETYNYEGNFYGLEPVTAVIDKGVITSVEALEAAYAEYLKNIN